MSTNLVEPLEQIATNLLDTLADALVGKASTLRDGTEHAGVELPRDLYAHKEAQTEWWYYTGHMQTARGRRFGFEFVFFKRRTDLDRFGVVPLRLIANPLYLAHFAVTDESRTRFRYAHRKSANNPFDPPARMSEHRYFLQLGDWTVREAHGLHLLRATLGDDLIFEVACVPRSPPRSTGTRGSASVSKTRGRRRVIFLSRGWRQRATSRGMARRNTSRAQRGWIGSSARGARPRSRRAGIGLASNLRRARS